MDVILDNIIFSLQPAGGISVMWGKLVSMVSGELPAVRIMEYPGSGANIVRRGLDLSGCHTVYRYCPAQLAQILPAKVPPPNKRPFIFHSSYFRLCNHPHAVNVVTLHDLTYARYAVNFKQRYRLALNLRAVAGADAVVCVSHNTRNDLMAMRPDIDPARVHVIHNGVSECFRPLGEVPCPEMDNTVLYVGSRKYYKNFGVAVGGIALTSHRLHIAGAPLSYDERTLLDSSLPGRWSAETYPSDERLNELYNSVFALAYPSSYEGFGLPPAESCRAGCPVIALRTSSVPEIAGNSPLLMETPTPEELARKLEAAADPDLRRAAINAGRAASGHLTWQKMGASYLALYKKLLNFAH